MKSIFVVFFLVFSIDGMELVDGMMQLQCYYAQNLDNAVKNYMLPREPDIEINYISRQETFEKYKSLYVSPHEVEDNVFVEQIDFAKRIKHVILSCEARVKNGYFSRETYKAFYLAYGAEKDFLNDLESHGRFTLTPTKKIIIDNRFSIVEYALARENCEILVLEQKKFLLYYLRDSCDGGNNCFLDNFSSFGPLGSLRLESYIFPQAICVQHYKAIIDSNYFNCSEMFVYHPGTCDLAHILFNSAQYYNQNHGMLEDKYAIPKYMLHIFHKNIETVKPFLKDFMYEKNILLSYITKARSIFIDYVIKEQSDKVVEAIVKDEWLFPKKMMGGLDAGMILFSRKHKKDLISLQLLQSREQLDRLSLYKELNEKIDALMCENKQLKREKDKYVKEVQDYEAWINTEGKDYNYKILEPLVENLTQQISNICDIYKALNCQKADNFAQIKIAQVKQDMLLEHAAGQEKSKKLENETKNNKRSETKKRHLEISSNIDLLKFWVTTNQDCYY